MNLPAFTNPDPRLIRSDSGRDPLGLLPIWSEFGRHLVPNLAGPVTQIKGITAVLLTHYLFEKLFTNPGLNGRIDFRAYFRLMEGLLEWYLWRELEGRHCFGMQTFATGAIFTVKADDSRTVINGLYQYYRGTCRRARLLSPEWDVEREVAESLAAAWSPGANAQLKPILLRYLAQNSGPMTPSDVFKGNPKLRDALKAVFTSQTLNRLLHDRLFGDRAHLDLARHCSDLLNATADPEKTPLGRTLMLLEQLRERITESDLAYGLRDHLERIAKCEPFLIAVQDSFDYMRCRPGARIDDVAAGLTGYSEVIAKRARNFLGLADSARNARSRQMLALAEAACAGFGGFLPAILEYHTNVAEDRDREPMVMLEGNRILALIPPDRHADEIRRRLEKGYPWDNGYYLATAGNLYSQAKEALHG